MQPCPGKPRIRWMAIRLPRKSLAACVLSMLTSAAPVAAGVIRIAIDQKQSPAYDGKSFGGVGQYEILTGRAFGELDPKDPHNTIITDLEFAPRNPRGKVQYVATFIVVKPIDLAIPSPKYPFPATSMGKAPIRQKRSLEMPQQRQLLSQKAKINL